MDIIKREQLKNNFLKATIIRLDFQNILDKDMIEILPMVKEYAKNHGFDKYEEKNSGEIKVSVTERDFGTPDVTSDVVNEKKIYCFTNEIGYSLELTDSFVVVKFVSTKYITFEKQFKIISDIISILSEKSSFFTEKRFGVRKINKCLLRDKSLITRYFNPAVVNSYKNENIENTMISKQLDVFAKGECLTNFNRSIIQGKSNDEILYQIELDIDTYIQEKDSIKNTIYDEEKVTQLNDIIFEIFISSLSEELIKNLCMEEFELPDIIGVESNE